MRGRRRWDCASQGCSLQPALGSCVAELAPRPFRMTSDPELGCTQEPASGFAFLARASPAYNPRELARANTQESTHKQQMRSSARTHVRTQEVIVRYEDARPVGVSSKKEYFRVQVASCVSYSADIIRGCVCCCSSRYLAQAQKKVVG